jgi:hypothetical protein
LIFYTAAGRHKKKITRSKIQEPNKKEQKKKKEKEIGTL